MEDQERERDADTAPLVLVKNKGTVMVDFLYQPGRIWNLLEDMSLGVSVTIRVFPEKFNWWKNCPDLNIRDTILWAGVPN